MNKKLNNNKVKIAIISLLVVFTMGVGLTLAYLATATSPVVNTFTPGSVTTRIEEKFKDNVKTDVKIKNTGNVDAYIRAAVVVNWIDEDKNVLGDSPIAITDYEIVINTDQWFEKDGFYYHKSVVSPEEVTNVLISSVKPLKNKEGYTLSVEILGSGIQSLPTSVVKTEWNVYSVNGELSKQEE